MNVRAGVARLPIAAALVLVSCSGSAAGDLAADGSAERPVVDVATVAPAEVEDTLLEQHDDPPTTDVPTVDSAVADPNVPIETSDPSVISRRTVGVDVLVLPDGVDLPPDYTQAAVPVDAFAATQLTISEVIASAQAPPPFNDLNAEPTGAIDPIVDVSVDIRACRLVAVWVLPHPDQIVVGYEEYPELTCAVPLMHIVEFEVPRTGKNSEGEWDYSTVPWVVPLRRIGQFD